MNLKTCALIVGLLAVVAGTGLAEDLSTAYARQEVERSSGWQAYRLDEQEKSLRALADRVFATGRPSADGSAYQLERAAAPGGVQTATVLGEPGPAGTFRPRTLLVDYDLTDRAPGGGLRHRRWEAVVDLDSEGVRVYFNGAIARKDGASAPDLESDPRDEDGWGKALAELSKAWGIAAP